MRKITISEAVWDKLVGLDDFLVQKYKLSRSASHSRIIRIQRFLGSLSDPADYALCRFERWRALGFRCASFEGWVFAYEVFDDGIIIRDMSHGKLLSDVIE